MLVRREADESAESSVRDFEEILQYGKAFLPPWQATEATRFEDHSRRGAGDGGGDRSGRAQGRAPEAASPPPVPAVAGALPGGGVTEAGIAALLSTVDADWLQAVASTAAARQQAESAQPQPQPQPSPAAPAQVAMPPAEMAAADVAPAYSQRAPAFELDAPGGEEQLGAAMRLQQGTERGWTVRAQRVDVPGRPAC